MDIEYSPLSISNENNPSRSVKVERFVFLSFTVAPIAGSPVVDSKILPRIVPFCAKVEIDKSRNSKVKNLFILVIKKIGMSRKETFLEINNYYFKVPD